MKKSEFIKNQFYSMPNGVHKFIGFELDRLVFKKDGVEFRVHESYIEALNITPIKKSAK